MKIFFVVLFEYNNVLVERFKAHRTYKRASSLPCLSKLPKIITIPNTTKFNIHKKNRKMSSNRWVKIHSVEIIKMLELENTNLSSQALNYYRCELIICEEILSKNIKDIKTKGNYNLHKLVTTKNFVNNINDEVIGRMYH